MSGPNLSIPLVECPWDDCNWLVEETATYCHGCERYVADATRTDEHLKTSETHGPGEKGDPRSEAQIRQAIKARLELEGWVTYDLEQNRKTRQTPGLADLYACGHGRTVWIEVKRHGTRQSANQVVFEEDVTRNGGSYYVLRHEREVDLL